MYTPPPPPPPPPNPRVGTERQKLIIFSLRGHASEIEFERVSSTRNPNVGVTAGPDYTRRCQSVAARRHVQRSAAQRRVVRSSIAAIDVVCRISARHSALADWRRVVWLAESDARAARCRRARCARCARQERKHVCACLCLSLLLSLSFRLTLLSCLRFAFSRSLLVAIWRTLLARCTGLLCAVHSALCGLLLTTVQV